MAVTQSTKKEIAKMELDVSQVTRTTSLLNQNQIQKLWNTTPAKAKYSRPAKGGGSPWIYVKGYYVRQVLDSVFGFNWDFVIETSVSEALEVADKTGTVVVKGHLIGRVKSDGEWIELSKGDYGRQEVKRKKDGTGLLDFGNDVKGAATDCFKRCASRFGIADDVYNSDDFIEISIVGSDENSDREKAAKQRAADAKAALDAEGEAVGGQNVGAS